MSTQKNPEFHSFYLDPEIAGRYDTERARTVKQRVVRDLERDFFVRHTAGAASVLEIGAGTGEITKLLAAKSSVTAIDISPAMLAHAKEKTNSDSVSFVELDMFKLAELEGTFDAAVASRVFLHLDPKPLTQMLRLAARKLNIGGKLVFDLQRPSIFRRALGMFERHKVENPGYSKQMIEAAVKDAEAFEIELIELFDHWPVLLPLAFVRGSEETAGSALHRFGISTERSLSKMELGASRWGIVCRRR